MSGTLSPSEGGGRQAAAPEEAAPGAAAPHAETAGAAAAEALFARNLAALSGRFPELAALVAAAAPAAIEGLTAASGEPSARGSGGALLHSGRDPRAEARRVVEAALARDAGADTAALLGLGLGYYAEACLEAGVPRAIVCESDSGALGAAFRIRDLAFLLVDERLGFVVGGDPDGLVSALEMSGGTRAAVLELKAATSTDSAWFEAARNAARRWNAKGEVNENTLARFGKLWVRNLSRNLAEAAISPGVEKLEGLFSASPIAAPMPAVILAAGPSLDLVLPYIEAISRRALVVCVDTALRSLLRYGIEPDFLVVVDPQYWNWRHLAGLSAPSAFLVSESSAWPAVFRSARRGAFLGGSLFPLGRRIEGFSGRKGHLGAGGSVATSAWDLGRILGCSPLWMAGLDLSFPEGQTHAKASLFEQRALASGRRLEPASSDQAAALVGGRTFQAPAADGRAVRTDERMTLYAWWFESRFSRELSPPTIALGRAGLEVQGLARGTVEQLLACPERRGEIEEGLARAEAAVKSAAGTRAEAALARGLGSLREQLGGIAREAETALRAAAEGRERVAAGMDCSACLAALEKADAYLLGAEARDVAGFLLPPLPELVGRGSRDLGESLERSESLYRRLAESARYHLEVLRSPS